MPHCQLPDRAIVAVTGEEAESLLNRLVTNSVLGMEGGAARYAALLSPQGKLLFDFLVLRSHDGYWLDGPADLATELARKLTLFKLRAKVAIALEPDLAVAASWGGPLMEAPGQAFRDPRHDRLGYRIVAAPDRLASMGADTAAYEAHRIGLGVPRGGIDWPYGDTFVHDANLDLLHGVDFGKGCYVGQEVVSRVHHRNSARKRVVKLHFYGAVPEVGAPLAAGDAMLGTVTSLAGDEGLAAARVDRLAEAEASKVPVTAGETLVGVTLPAASAVTPPDYAEAMD